MSVILEVKGLCKHFGGVEANSEVSFRLDRGEIVGLIGPNGAGKTTLFNCIAGFHKPDSGQVLFDGQDITGQPPYRTNRLGIARTFQTTVSGGDLSVREEVMTGAFCRVSDRHQAAGMAEEIVEYLGLGPVGDKRIYELPVAMQKRVGLGRALATRPRLLMLDEVAAGLTASEIDQFMSLIRRVKAAQGLTVFVIEHVMALVMEISQRVLVLDGGIKICEGPPEEVVKNEEVIKAYLGVKYVSRKSG